MWAAAVGAGVVVLIMVAGGVYLAVRISPRSESVTQTNTEGPGDAAQAPAAKAASPAAALPQPTVSTGADRAMDATTAPASAAQTQTALSDRSPERVPGFADTMPGERFPETRSRRLTADDLRGWNAETLRYAINELYAKGGYDFRRPEVKALFSSFPWYQQRLVRGRTQDEAAAHLTPLEYENLAFLQRVRDQQH
jgi:hypothetical protein